MCGERMKKVRFSSLHNEIVCVQLDKRTVLMHFEKNNKVAACEQASLKQIALISNKIQNIS